MAVVRVEPDDVEGVVGGFVGRVRLDVAELVEDALDFSAGVFNGCWRRFG